MNKALIFAIGVASTTVLVSAHAQTYRWMDANGKVIISDRPPPGTAKDTRAIGAHKPRVVVDSESTAEASAPKPQTMADKEEAFKKRFREEREKAEQEAKDAANAKQRQEACEQAKRQLAALESDQPIARLNDKGERQALEGEQRRQEIERVRTFMQSVCQ